MKATCTFIDEGITVSLRGTRAILMEDVVKDGYVHGTVSEAQIPLYPEEAKKLYDELGESIRQYEVINESHKAYEKGYTAGVRDANEESDKVDKEVSDKLIGRLQELSVEQDIIDIINSHLG